MDHVKQCHTYFVLYMMNYKLACTVLRVQTLKKRCSTEKVGEDFIRWCLTCVTSVNGQAGGNISTKSDFHFLGTCVNHLWRWWFHVPSPWAFAYAECRKASPERRWLKIDVKFKTPHMYKLLRSLSVVKNKTSNLKHVTCQSMTSFKGLCHMFVESLMKKYY